VGEANRASATRALDVLAASRPACGERATIAGPTNELAVREARLEALQDSPQRSIRLAMLRKQLPQAQAALKAALEHERAVQRRVTELGRAAMRRCSCSRGAPQGKRVTGSSAMA
jgi:chromosome segregation protein